MAKGISIGVAADTGPFSSAVKKGVLDPLTDVQEALTKTTGSADDAGAQLETSMKGAQKATVDFEKQITATNQTITKNSKQTYQEDEGNFELSTREKTRLSREALTTLGDQVKQQVGVVATSFDGSVGDLAQSAEGAAIGLLSFIPGWGLAIGAAAATGLSVIQGILGKDDATTKQLKEDGAALAKQYIETGKDGAKALSGIASNLEDLATETDDSKDSLIKIAAAAKAAGIEYKGLADSVAGDNTNLQAIHDKAQQQLDDIKSGQTALYGVFGIVDTATDQQSANLQKVIDLTGAQIDVTKTATTEAKLAAQAGIADYEQKAGLLKQVNDAYSDLDDSTSTYLDTEKGLFNVQDYINAMTARAKALDDYRADLLSSGLSTDAKDFLEGQGEETASLLLSGYEKASPAQQAALNNIWAAQGQSAAGSFTGSFQGAVSGASVKGPKVVPPEFDVTSFISAAQRKLDTQQLKVNTEFLTRNGVRVI